VLTWRGLESESYESHTTFTDTKIFQLRGVRRVPPARLGIWFPRSGRQLPSCTPLVDNANYYSFSPTSRDALVSGIKVTQNTPNRKVDVSWIAA